MNPSKMQWLVSQIRIVYSWVSPNFLRILQETAYVIELNSLNHSLYEKVILNSSEIILMWILSSTHSFLYNLLQFLMKKEFF